jgi:drug/metabolite transporter (DMT)-like permease
VGRGLGTDVPVLSLLALVAGAVCLFEGAVVFRLFPQSNPVVTNAVASTTGALLLIGLSLGVGEEWILPAETNTWAAAICLVVLGSVLMFYVYLYILARWTASATSYGFLLFPVATVPIAALLAGEVITLSFFIGGALGPFGVWLGVISDSHGVTASDPSATTMRPWAIGREGDPVDSRKLFLTRQARTPAVAVGSPGRNSQP